MSPAPQPKPHSPSRFARAVCPRVTLAQRLGVDEKAVRRMLDQEFVIETRAA